MSSQFDQELEITRTDFEIHHQQSDVLEADPANMQIQFESDDDLTALILQKTTLFIDQHGIVHAFARMQEPFRHRCYRVRSRAFETLVRQIFGVRRLTRRELSDLIEALEGNAIQADTRIDLNPRFANHEEKIYLDLCNDADHVVEVDATGWRIGTQDRPMFVRHPHQLPLQAPRQVNDVNLNSFNSILSEFDERLQLLLLAWLTSCIVLKVETPILACLGPPGSGKSTFCRNLKALIDPSNSPDIGNIQAGTLPLIFQQHAIPSLENVSDFSRETADQLCRATTGASTFYRRYFTNDEAGSFRYRRPVLLNGVELPSNRPDFLDRCIVIYLSRRANNEAIELVESRHRELQPCLLGSLLTLIQRALALPTTSGLDCPFRMASFVNWGRKIARTLGLPETQFDASYSHNLETLGRDALETDLHLRLIFELASRYTQETAWTGAITTLLQLLSRSKLLKEHAGREGLVFSPKSLNQKLKELQPLLKTVGVVVEQLPRTNSTRPWRIYSMNPQSIVSRSVS